MMTAHPGHMDHWSIEMSAVHAGTGGCDHTETAGHTGTRVHACLDGNASSGGFTGIHGVMFTSFLVSFTEIII